MAAWIKKFRHDEVNEGIYAFTGDLFNSSRRPDELFHNEFDLMTSVFKGVDLFSQFLLDGEYVDLDQAYVFGVAGNESRLALKWNGLSWNENLDGLAHRMMAERLYPYRDKIKFASWDAGDKMVSVGGANIVLTHGHHGNNFNKILEKFKHRVSDPIPAEDSSLCN